jgi:hypothetical protein
MNLPSPRASTCARAVSARRRTGNRSAGLYPLVHAATAADGAIVADIGIWSWRVAYRGLLAETLLASLSAEDKVRR